MNINFELSGIFNSLFDENLKKTITRRQAYEETEREFQAQFNHRKYSSFESFRITRSRKIRHKKGNLLQ
jgi:hypothetical protein